MKSNSSHSSRKGESRGKYVVDFLTMEGESNIQCETVHEMGYVPEDDSEETSVENAYTVSWYQTWGLGTKDYTRSIEDNLWSGQKRRM